MNSCCSKARVYIKQCVELGTFMNLLSGMALWAPSFSGAFLAHTRLDPATLFGNSEVQVLAGSSAKPSLSGNSMGKSGQGQFHLAQVQGLWPHCFHYA